MISTGTTAAGLTICINTRNRPGGLARLLAALVPQVATKPDCAIVVVNDGSHDTRYDTVIRGYDAKVYYHQITPQVGIAAARNIAASHADGAFLVFIDDDCVPPPFWLDWLLSLLSEQPDLDLIAGVTKALLPAKPSFFAKVQAAFGLYPNPEKRLGGMRFVTANLAIRRSLFHELRGFRAFPGGPASGSDSDLSVRVSQTAKARRLDPDWYVLHDVGEPVLSCLRRYWRYGYADIWLSRFAKHETQPTLPPMIAESRFDFLRRSITANRLRARDSFPSPPAQLAAALLATLIQQGYEEGRRAGRRAKPPASTV
jgi:glycosyltransferase involved in cell wall biosynthesis